MPLFKSLNYNSQTNVKVWKICNQNDQLHHGIVLKPYSQNRLNNLEKNINKAQFLAARQLLHLFNYSDQSLHYDQNGKPYLEDGKFISISHSFNFVAMAISTTPVGIDIEQIRPKIKNIVSKFIGLEACFLDLNSKDYLDSLTQIWTAKESSYKLYGKPGMNFKDQFLVLPKGTDSDCTNAWVIDGDKRSVFLVKYQKMDAFICATTMAIN